MSGKTFWNVERLAIVRLHAKTCSASQIAALFPGVSRNAVISAANRNGIELGKPHHGRAPRLLKPRPPKRAPDLARDKIHMRGSTEPELVRPAMQRSLPPDPPADDDKPVRQLSFERYAPGQWTLWNIGSDQCRFPIGHNGVLTLYCGATVMRDGCAYCGEHYMRTRDRASSARSANVVPFR